MLRAFLVWAIASVLIGCLSVPDPPLEAAGGPRVLALEVLGHDGKPWDEGGIPRKPRIVLHLSGPLVDVPFEGGLFEGPPDATLVEDLADPPLRRDTDARRVAVVETRSEATLTWTPERALAPGLAYTVALVGTAGDAASFEPFVETLEVSPDAHAGATATGAWPADGTAGVPPSSPLLAVRFDGTFEPSAPLSLVEGDGAEVPTTASTVPCEAIGWDGGHCATLVPRGPLAPNRDHRLVLSGHARDATGAPLDPWESAFRTGLGEPAEPVAIAADRCGIDEQPGPAGCVLADDASITLTVRADRPVRLFLEAGPHTRRALAPRGEGRLHLGGLAPDTRLDGTLTAVELSGARHRVDVSLATTPPLPRVAITEVRSDPEGPEPHQEYVEVQNQGEAAVDLTGFWLSDTPGREGDLIEDAPPIPPGGHALLVPAGFDPEHPDDVPVPPGTLLIRLDGSLGSGGLRNGGEPLFLRDPGHRRITAAPATPAPESGVCRYRVAEDPRTGAPGSFAHDPTGTCTPGRAPETPP